MLTPFAFFVCLFLILTLPALSIQAQQPQALPAVSLQGAYHYVFRVGSVEITALSDRTVPQDLHVLLRNTTEAKTDNLLRDAFLTNPVEASINIFFFRIQTRVVLVDTGAGDFFGQGNGGKLLQSLAAIGVQPEQITDILLTHAHNDHMGGLVHQGQLAFPNAIVHMGQADLDFFFNRANAKLAHYDVSYFDQASTALKPYLDADKIKAFRETTEVLPGVSATMHPGHTPGSVFYTLSSNGQTITFTGDIIHVAAVQAPAPEITITYDVDPDKAAAVRIKAFSQFAKGRTLIAAPHLSFPGVGHLKQTEPSFEWIPISFGNRLATDKDGFANPHKNGNQQ